MSNWHQHRSSPAKPGPPPERPRPPAPPPPPRWRVWVLLAGIVLTVLLFFAPSMSRGTPTQSFTYTAFINQVTTNQVKTATISATGHVSGKLANGNNYTSQVPTAQTDLQLLPLLQQHNVQIAATGTGGTSIATVLLNLLPLVLFLGFFIYLGRRARRQLAGGIMGIGSSKAKG